MQYNILLVRILFVGYAVIDLIDQRPFLGGAGGSMSINASKIGVSSSFFGPLSEDVNGMLYQQALQASGVDFSFCDMRSSSIPTCEIVDPFGHGSTRRWEDHGARAHFMQMSIHPQSLRSFDRIFLCNAPPEVGEKIARAIPDRRLFYIPGPMAVKEPGWVRQEILEKTLIAFANQEESPELWKSHPFQHGVSVVVSTQGSKGGVVRLASEKHMGYRSTKNVRVVDTTGAGDAWALGFATVWQKNGDEKKAIQNGKKFAGLSIQTMGTLLPL